MYFADLKAACSKSRNRSSCPCFSFLVHYVWKGERNKIVSCHNNDVFYPIFIKIADRRAKNFEDAATLDCIHSRILLERSAKCLRSSLRRCNINKNNFVPDNAPYDSCDDDGRWPSHFSSVLNLPSEER